MKKKGFTLIELIATMAIMTIFFTMVFNIESVYTKISKNSQDNVDLQDNTKLVFYKIENALKKVKIDFASSDESYIKSIVTLSSNEKPYLYLKPMNYNVLIPEKPFIFVMKKINGINELHKISLKIDGLASASSNIYYAEDLDDTKVSLLGSTDVYNTTKLITDYFNSGIVLPNKNNDIFKDGTKDVWVVYPSNFILRQCFKMGDDKYSILVEDSSNSIIKYRINLIRVEGVIIENNKYLKDVDELVCKNFDASFTPIQGKDGNIEVKVFNLKDPNKYYETSIFYKK